MSFGGDIKKFTGKARTQIHEAEEQAKQNLSRRLEEVLGEDVHLIKGGKFDLETGMFTEVGAPADIIDRLRAAGLMKD